MGLQLWRNSSVIHRFLPVPRLPRRRGKSTRFPRISEPSGPSARRKGPETSGPPGKRSVPYRQTRQIDCRRARSTCSRRHRNQGTNQIGCGLPRGLRGRDNRWGFFMCHSYLPGRPVQLVNSMVPTRTRVRRSPGSKPISKNARASFASTFGAAYM